MFSLYCETLRSCIDKTWGWDEEFQQKWFSENLSPEKFEIVVLNGNNVGGYCLQDRGDHFYLEMLLLHPEYQSMGIGKSLMQGIIKAAASKNLKLKLSVIKANPVKPFYEKLGFVQYDEDSAFYRLEHRITIAST